ncbi:MAG: T9SS type A sorting domain-containing protein [Lentimicrobium sp.]
MKILSQIVKVLFVCSAFSTFGIKDASSQDWIRIYGQNTYWAFPLQSKETYDKGYLIRYAFRKYEIAYEQSAIFKTNINGYKLWEKTFGNYLNTMVRITGMSLTPDGGVIICGITTIEDDQGDPFTMKLNACMEAEWCNIYSTPNWQDGGADIKYVLWDNTYIWNLYNTAYDEYEKREFVMKLDSTGNTIWYNLYATNTAYDSEIFQDLNISEIDSSFVLNGLVYVYNVTSGWWELNPYWLKIADNGDFLWEKYSVQHPDYDLGLSRYTTILKSGNIASSASDSPATYHLLIDKQGNELISVPMYMPDSIFGSTSNTIEVYKDSILLNGMQYITAPFDPCCSVIQVTDTLGNFLNEIVIPVDFDAITTDIEITFDNKILIATDHDNNTHDFMLIKYNENFEYDSIYTHPYTYDSLCPGGITSGNIDLGCSVITGIKEEIKEGRAKLTLAPNPAKDYTVVFLPETIATNEKQGPFDVITVRSDYVRNLKMDVFDLNGRQVSSFAWPDEIKEQVINTSAWPTGMYLIRISSPARTIANGKLLINK